jgi:hypothetical protein
MEVPVISFMPAASCSRRDARARLRPKEHNEALCSSAVELPVNRLVGGRLFICIRTFGGPVGAKPTIADGACRSPEQYMSRQAVLPACLLGCGFWAVSF